MQRNMKRGRYNWVSTLVRIHKQQNTSDVIKKVERKYTTSSSTDFQL